MAALDTWPHQSDTPPVDPEGEMPCSLDAEWGVLGAILYDNAAFELITIPLSPADFIEPIHGEFFRIISKGIGEGRLVDPVLLHESVSERWSKAYEDLGGVRYLADLYDKAPPLQNAPEYARIVKELALRREIIRIAQGAAKEAKTGDNELSAAQQIEALESQLYALAESGQTQKGFVPLSHVIGSAINVVAKAIDREGDVAGLATGLIDLDRKTGGLHPGNLMIVAGRPSMGKSALAVNVGYDIARRFQGEQREDGTVIAVRGGRVGLFELEMSEEELGLRILAEASGVAGQRMKNGDVDELELSRIMEAAQEISDTPLYTDVTGAISISALAAKARRLKRQYGLELLIIDYLQLVTAGDARTPREQQVTMVTQGLKALAKELGIPIIALSQLSRQVENRADKKPQLADLRESGAIEQDADSVLFVYREHYYLERQEPREGTPEHLTWQDDMDRARGVAELIIGKNRHGPVGSVKLAFNGEITKFGNLMRDPD